MSVLRRDWAYTSGLSAVGKHRPGGHNHDQRSHGRRYYGRNEEAEEHRRRAGEGSSWGVTVELDTWRTSWTASKEARIQAHITTGTEPSIADPRLYSEIDPSHAWTVAAYGPPPARGIDYIFDPIYQEASGKRSARTLLDAVNDPSSVPGANTEPPETIYRGVAVPTERIGEFAELVAPGAVLDLPLIACSDRLSVASGHAYQTDLKGWLRQGGFEFGSTAAEDDFDYDHPPEDPPPPPPPAWTSVVYRIKAARAVQAESWVSWDDQPRQDLPPEVRSLAWSEFRLYGQRDPDQWERVPVGDEWLSGGRFRVTAVDLDSGTVDLVQVGTWDGSGEYHPVIGKHYGPGDHPSGSSQDAHAGDGADGWPWRPTIEQSLASREANDKKYRRKHGARERGVPEPGRIEDDADAARYRMLLGSALPPVIDFRVKHPLGPDVAEALSGSMEQQLRDIGVALRPAGMAEFSEHQNNAIASLYVQVGRKADDLSVDPVPSDLVYEVLLSDRRVEVEQAPPYRETIHLKVTLQARKARGVMAAEAYRAVDRYLRTQGFTTSLTKANDKDPYPSVLLVTGRRISKHYGPGDHPSGSSQDVHGGEGSRPEIPPPQWSELQGRFISEVPVSFLESIREYRRLGDNPITTVARSQEKVDEIAASVVEEGWSDPVIIELYFDDNGRVLAQLAEGNHRLEVAKKLGLTTLPAKVIVRSYEFGRRSPGSAPPVDVTDLVKVTIDDTHPPGLKGEYWTPADFFDFTKLEKHYGPGDHPSGSSQDAHAGGGGGGDSSEWPWNPTPKEEEASLQANKKRFRRTYGSVKRGLPPEPQYGATDDEIREWRESTWAYAPPVIDYSEVAHPLAPEVAEALAVSLKDQEREMGLLLFPSGMSEYGSHFSRGLDALLVSSESGRKMLAERKLAEEGEGALDAPALSRYEVYLVDHLRSNNLKVAIEREGAERAERYERATREQTYERMSQRAEAYERVSSYLERRGFTTRLMKESERDRFPNLLLVTGRRISKHYGPGKLEKHYQGQHDQEDHGNWADGGLTEGLTARHPGLDFYVEEDDEGRVSLSKLVVPKARRNEGLGSAFMDDLVAWADRNGKTLVLTPEVKPEWGGGSLERLRRFYRRYGFVYNRSRNRDWAITEDMYRLPQVQKHYGPGDHPSGTSQDVHGDRGMGGDHPVREVVETAVKVEGEVQRSPLRNEVAALSDTGQEKIQARIEEYGPDGEVFTMEDGQENLLAVFRSAIERYDTMDSDRGIHKAEDLPTWLDKLPEFWVEDGKVVTKQPGVRDLKDALVEVFDDGTWRWREGAGSKLREIDRFYRRFHEILHIVSRDNPGVLPMERLVAACAVLSPGMESNDNLYYTLEIAKMALENGGRGPVLSNHVVEQVNIQRQIEVAALEKQLASPPQSWAKDGPEALEAKLNEVRGKIAALSVEVRQGDAMLELEPELMGRAYHWTRIEIGQNDPERLDSRGQRYAGLPARYGYGSFEKAMSILAGHEDIDDLLNGLKVRSYNNNIMDPGNHSGRDDVTVDFHMMNAYYRALGADDNTTEKKGGDKNAPGTRFTTGLTDRGASVGILPALADAIRSVHSTLGHKVSTVGGLEAQEIIWAEWQRGQHEGLWGWTIGDTSTAPRIRLRGTTVRPGFKG